METAASGVGIIGGADGPTAIFITGPLNYILGDKSLLAIWFAVVVLAYFLGNISPSTLLAKARGIDIKKEGSGNAGTTNALRVLGKKAAIVTLIVDIGKGVLAVFIGRWAGAYCFAKAEALIVAGTSSTSVGEGIVEAMKVGMINHFAISCGFFVFIGHIWPVVLKFKGGKGAATAFGVLVSLHPLMGLLTLAVVVVGVLITHMVSAGSICGAIAVPFIALAFMPEFFFTAILMAVIVIIKHRTNIKRILKHTESKLF